MWIGSLYELAKDKMNYASKGLIPLSVDGAEGRIEQREYIEMFVKESLKDTYFCRQLLPNCSENFRNQIEQTPIEERFLREIINEISCVLDAEGIRKGRQEKVEDYLKAKREHWQMSLPNEADRRAVLEIHDRYYRFLSDSNIISIDQMVADFLRYLDSHEWGYLRGQEGYDRMFVDELHYFNYNKRMVFHELFRSNSMELSEEGADNRSIPLFMAYDLKQSPDDRFLGSLAGGSASRFFRSLKAGKSELVELTDVFRSTPEIAGFLEHLDGKFPALDLEGEWQTYSGVSKRESGRTQSYGSLILMLNWWMGFLKALIAKRKKRVVETLLYCA